jgi:hypothetical protein
MAGDLAYQGSMTLGGAMPLALAAEAQLGIAVNVSLPDIQAKIAGVLEAQVRLSITPPSIATNLQIALDIVASLELAPPVIDVQVALLASLLAELQVQFAQLSVAAAFDMNLGTAGIHVYTYSGDSASLSAAFATGLAGGLPGVVPSQQVSGVFLAAATPSATAALNTFFGVT